ncbi:conserved Plasmodium protein, unknown function [Plasmodium ovale wallikeri]|uniref:Uncharacterized protein n=1 Tax=Plasmodium ovale wallikeri TaxID=864142 RepID=A0A1A8YNI7_PLAOA|nr:conserved Plasmodium protein, unknown function [Plasmodium ovale wallikeri]SBT33075.1 conserved Plasmodium protein, unknown function [Plasmodium ovale wallikeri]
MCTARLSKHGEAEGELINAGGGNGLGEKARNAGKKELKEVLRRVYVGNYEDSKNVLLMNSTGITHVIIVRCSQEDQTARIIFPHTFEYYIIDVKNDFDFTNCSHFKYLLDEILFENEINRIFIHRLVPLSCILIYNHNRNRMRNCILTIFFLSYFALRNILCLLIFYLVTTFNHALEDAISHVRKTVSNFSLTVEDTDKIYYFTKRHKLIYYPGECTSYLEIKDSKGDENNSVPQ